MNWTKIIYWISTGLMCLIFTFSAGMYILNYDQVVEMFPSFGFPGWLVAPLAALKILGIIAVLTRKSHLLKEWAYAGFFFDAVLAFAAHRYVRDGGEMAAAIAVIAVIVSRIYDQKLFGGKL